MGNHTEKSDDKRLRSVLNELLDRIENNDINYVFPKLTGLNLARSDFFLHTHSELFYQQSGISEFTFPEEKILLNPGDFLTVPHGLPHREKLIKVDDEFLSFVISPHSTSTMVHLSYNNDRFKAPVISYPEILSQGKENIINELTLGMVNIFELPDEVRETMVKGLLMSMCILIKHLLAKAGESTERQKIQFIKHMICTNFNDPELSVKSLAKSSSYSPDYLSYLFHNETGQTLNAFITKVRINKAQELLKDINLSISEISWMCGFNSPAYFSRVFSQKTGKSPKRFRN